LGVLGSLLLCPRDLARASSQFFGHGLLNLVRATPHLGYREERQIRRIIDFDFLRDWQQGLSKSD
jgi:hypothetical protein